MFGILILAVFALGFVMSIKILKVARRGINQGVLYKVSGCLNYKYALAIGVIGFSLTGAYLWLSLLNVVAFVVAGHHG